MTLRCGTLFSGFGLMDLGLQRAGMEIVFQVEINDYARGVLGKHWPDVPTFSDIRDVRGRDLPGCDVLAGGFPCSEISRSQPDRYGGIDGQHSGLWGEFARLLGEIRPRYVLVENTPNLLKRGMGRVLGDLAAVGYDAEWSIVSACALGAPHTRERLFIVAYPVCTGLQRPLTAGMQHPESAPWRATPQLRGSTDACPAWVERLRGLGSGITPPQAEYVGRLIIAHAARE